MDLIDLCGEAPSIYNESILAAFASQKEKNPARAIRFTGRRVRGVKEKDVVAAIDGQLLGCPLLILHDLPPDHHVRMAIGGRPCVGVFARRDIARLTVLGLYTGKWFTVEEFEAVEKHHPPSYHRFVF